MRNFVTGKHLHRDKLFLLLAGADRQKQRVGSTTNVPGATQCGRADGGAQQPDGGEQLDEYIGLTGPRFFETTEDKGQDPTMYLPTSK
jgi:hypothetical protein